MKYLKVFEYKHNLEGTLAKMYSGRYINVMLKHCQILNDRGIDYDIYVDIDDVTNQDLVYIIIKDEYKNLFYDYVKILGYKPIDIKQLELNNLAKFDSIVDYLNYKKEYLT